MYAPDWPRPHPATQGGRGGSRGRIGLIPNTAVPAVREAGAIGGAPPGRVWGSKRPPAGGKRRSSEQNVRTPRNRAAKGLFKGRIRL